MQGLTDGHKKLKAWLKEPNRSQSALARKLNITQTAVALWVKPGHRPSPLLRDALERLGICLAKDWETKKERERREALEQLGGAA